jgi:CubicO group peptidase (beta-lactamase class C family)
MNKTDNTWQRAFETQLADNPTAFEGLKSLLVCHQGQLKATYFCQGYDAQTLHEAQSVTKSIQALIVGALADRGLVDIHQPIYPYFEQTYGAYFDTPQKRLITPYHLLTHTAGWEWNESQVPYTNLYNDANLQFYGDNWLEYALSKPHLHPPGEVFNYSSASPILLAYWMNQLDEELTHLQYAYDYFYRPLAIDRVEYQIEQSTNPEAKPLAADAYLCAEGLLTIAEMMRQNGQYRGQQIVSEQWIAQCLHPHISLRQTYASAYGYSWWLQESKNGLPAYYYAWGYGGQHIFVVPTLGLSLVTAGSFYQEGAPALDPTPFALLHTAIQLAQQQG